MEPGAFHQWTERLRAQLAGDQRVIGLVLLGSGAERIRRPDTWSDHDFFVITRPGVQEELRQSLDWLPGADQIVLRPRETEHGLKVLFADGHVVEFAVFDPAEIRLARVNEWRVLLEPADGSITAVLRELEARDASLPSFDAGREIALMLSLLLVGSGRAARGEVISGGHLVKDLALAAFLRLLADAVTPAPGSAPDLLDPFRRVEDCYPQIVPRLHAALLLPPLEAASALLDLAEATLPALPETAVAVVRREIARARTCDAGKR